MRPLLGWTVQAVLIVLAATSPLGGDPLAVVERARSERRSGNLEAAAGLLAEAIAALGEPATGAAGAALHRELGAIRLDQKRPSDAAGHFEQALLLAPGQGVVHYQAGLAYRMAGKEAAAANHLRKAVESGFATTGAFLHLARAEFAAGNLSGGLAASRELLGMQPRSARTLLLVGRALFDRFFYGDALKAFEAALSITPGSYEARHFAALTNHLLNRHAEAVSLLAGLDPEHATSESTTLLASALGQQGRADEAIARFHEAIGRWPQSPHPRLNLAFMLLDLGRTEEAEARLDALLALGTPAVPKVFYSVGRDSCTSAAAWDGASGSAPPRDPTKAAAYLDLAAVLAGRQHHRTAIELLNLARSYQVESPRLLLALARSCLHVDPASAAPVSLLRLALQADPGLAEAHHLLGRVHLQQGRRQEALESHRKATVLTPGNSRFHTELARAHAAGLDDADRLAAVESLVRAAELDSGNAIARYELGKLLTAMGKHDEAIRVLEEAAGAEPELYNAYYQLGRACQRAGRRADAERYLKVFSEKRAAAEARAAPGAGFADGL